MADPPREAPNPYFGDYPNGPYWSAYVPIGDDSAEVEETYEIAGTMIRFMPEYGVTVPLWDEEGYLSEDPEWLNRALGLSPELVADLAKWGAEWDAPQLRLTAAQHAARDLAGAAEAQQLVERLRAELPPQFRVVVHL